MRQSRKGKRSKAKGRELRLKKADLFSGFSLILDPCTLNLEPRCLLPDTNICAKNACLRATHRDAVVEDKDFNCYF